MKDLTSLEKCFEDAKNSDSQFVAVEIQIHNCLGTEIIINPRENFDSKLEYYKNAYNENLTLKACPTIKIIDFAYGDSFSELELLLLG